MSKNPLPPALPPGKTNSVHIGHDRFALATQCAIEVSYKTREQITASQFVQHLVDNYSTLALQNWGTTSK
jgi:hypothetical protein